ncbi:FliH/SctL family protein [Nocardioides mangrovi]|uniref:Flagellar assembly protein FliH n=1 Tax=Nocardioides mangrovi TaxID=2874580 RepID=A0ABS7UAB1_9ACTN|nr:FliH/SctL family protein [Nocardioides mangrovi]MBZ5737812.1 flagellar assembly protein FliH [Nocardioides mangrovi]
MSEAQQVTWRTPERPDLRTGVWTRLGDHRVLGDGATEAVLGSLAERTREAARAQGYAVGWSEGHQSGLRRAADEAEVAREEAARREERREAEHAAAIAALARAAAELTRASAQVAAQIADQATDLALELTRELVGHELTVSADPGAGVVARVLSVLPRDPSTVVRLHPTIAGAVASELAEHGASVVPDPTLERHDAVVETAETAVDLRLGTALDRLREALS